MWDLMLFRANLVSLYTHLPLFFVVWRRRVYQYHRQRAVWQSVFQTKHVYEAKLLRKAECTRTLCEYGP
jgi:hypothetical protein